MSDPVYAKLIFNEFHVQYGGEPYGEEGVEVFDAHELWANGWEEVPLVEDFVKDAQKYWGVNIIEVRDKHGRLIYPAQ